MKRQSCILFVLFLLLNTIWGQEEHAIHFARLTAQATTGGTIVLPALSYYANTGGAKLPTTPKASDYQDYQELNISCFKDGVTSSPYYTDAPRLYIFVKPQTGYVFKGIYNEQGEKMAFVKHATKANLYYYDWTDMTSGYNPGTLDRYPIELNMRVMFAPSSSSEQTLIALERAEEEFIGWQAVASDGSTRFISFCATTPYFAIPGETVSPIYHFTTDPTPYFAVGEQVFTSLSDACTYAQAEGYHKVVLVGSGTLAESATLPAGIQLVIPHDGSLLGYQYWVDYGHDGLYGSAYRTLKVATGYTLTIEGVMSVSARQSSLSHAGCGPSSTVNGDYGLVLLEENATLLLVPGAELFAYGYISGPGKVELQDGATVYEMFQIMDWRGVGYMMDNVRYQLASYQQKLELFNESVTRYMIGDMSWDEVMESLTYPTQGFQYIVKNAEVEVLPKPFAADMIFPLNQYYIQNVESRMIFHHGATEKVCASLYASMDVHFDPFTLIGTDEGLFRLQEGALLTKYYDCQTDRQQYDLQGKVDVENIRLTSALMQMAFGFVTPLPLSAICSELYTLPIAHNMSIHLLDDAEVEIYYNMCMLPGSQIIIDDNAKLLLSPYSNLYVYDSADWNVHNLGGGGDYIPLAYTHCGGLSTNRFPQPETPADAAVIVNGTLEILADTIGWDIIAQNTDWDLLQVLEQQMSAMGLDPSTYKQPIHGGLYTTQGGANICSTAGGGTIRQNATCGTVQSVAHNAGTDGATEIPLAVYPALMKNGDGSYKTPTCSEPTTYTYSPILNEWVSDADEEEECIRTVTASALSEATGWVVIEIIDNE